MKKYAVIVAGGAGVRMGSDMPKQFLLLKHQPLIAYTLHAFLQAYTDLKIILVLPQQHIQRGYEIISLINESERITIAAGAPTRFESVKNGLAFIQQPSVVFVHDGVRCTVSVDLIKRCYEQAIELGSAIPAVQATDSIRINNESEHRVIDRSKVHIIQTPQTFLSSLLVPAFDQDYNPSFTDEATVVEASGKQVHLIEGEYNNIKVTRPIDLYIAEKLLEDGSLFQPV